MEVNLMHHSDAFATLHWRSIRRSAYAASFLKELFAQSGDQTKAAALYHAATPELEDGYQRKVLAVWPEEQRLGVMFSGSPLVQSWAATMPSAPPRFLRMQPPR
jgi:hypothetical protein